MSTILDKDNDLGNTISGSGNEDPDKKKSVWTRLYEFIKKYKWKIFLFAIWFVLIYLISRPTSFSPVEGVKRDVSHPLFPMDVPLNKPCEICGLNHTIAPKCMPKVTITGYINYKLVPIEEIKPDAPK